MGTNDFLESVLPLTETAERPEEAELLLAAYLEGRLEGPELERVEAWLASDPDALELLMASREGLDAPEAVAVPEALLDSAKALVGPALMASPATAAATDDLTQYPEEASLQLAAYLDGRLEGAEAERVEAWLASDPDALDLMVASREALDVPVEAAAPDALLGRAKGIIRPAARAPEAPRRSWLQALFGGFGGALQPVGVAAALLLACALGIGLGHSSFANLMAAQSLEAEGFDLGVAGDDLL